MDIDLLDALKHIDPASCTYDEWLDVGMGLHHEGHTASEWEDWSKADAGRYHEGECYRKWTGFHGAPNPVTGGTIIQMAKDRGWRPPEDLGGVLDWDATINDRPDHVVVDKHWIEELPIEEPEKWEPHKQLIRYLETLFDSTDKVGYVTKCWEKDGKFNPKKGNYDRTAGQLIEELHRYKDIADVVGDWNEAAGAWIRFNPLDGKDVTNDNVTEFRYALVESDNMDLGKQHAIMREMELPIAVLLYSGGKSIHAIVKVDAPDKAEYRKRVDYLYRVCQKNGLIIDQANRNPSRLSRMPGVTRSGRKQFIIDTNIGRPTWGDWFEWIEGVNDDLPDPEPLSAEWDHLPELATPLIDGVLRQGHKMLLAGPSKAGKSYALIQLCIGIAEGRTWLGWDCAKGRVMYVNLELDRASCLHRFKDVYKTLGWAPANVEKIDIWNLRGKAVPMDKLAPKLIRRAQKKDYLAVVIDPIYKVITGDENSADQMARFANQFDKICTELGTAVIYCHHHSKGYQGGKRSMDRASGSGVFARDPDALIDLTELEITDALTKSEEQAATCRAAAEIMERYAPDYLDETVGDDDMHSASMMESHARTALSASQMTEFERKAAEYKRKVAMRTAWRIEGTLREFPSFQPVNLWFDYPVHRVDRVGVLGDLQPESDKPTWQKTAEKKKDPKKRKEEQQNAVEIAFTSLEFDADNEQITVEDLAEEMGVSKKTVRRRLKEHGGFDVVYNGIAQYSTVKRKTTAT